LVTNIDLRADSTDFLASIEALVRNSPQEYDGIIDFGSEYLFDLISEDASDDKYNEYFQRFEAISKYIPYSLVAEEYTASGRTPSDEEWGTFLNTNHVQIRYLQTEGMKADPKVASAEDLFENYESANGRSRILFTNSPFYCSSKDSVCSKSGDNNRYKYEQAIVENDVDLIISGFGSEYERTYPVFEGTTTNIDDSADFEQEISYPVYITLNGPKGTHGSLTQKQPISLELSSEPSFGILEIKSNTSISFTQYSVDQDQVDHFNMIVIEKDNFENSTTFRYMIYAILISCILGFGYFIYNWIRCFLSKPARDDDSDSSDEEQYSGNMRQRRAVKQEMQQVLP